MSLRITCAECGNLISKGRPSDDYSLDMEEAHFGIGPVKNYDGTCTGSGGKMVVHIPLAHICASCVQKFLPNTSRSFSEKEFDKSSYERIGLKY